MVAFASGALGSGLMTGGAASLGIPTPELRPQPDDAADNASSPDNANLTLATPRASPRWLHSYHFGMSITTVRRLLVASRLLACLESAHAFVRESSRRMLWASGEAHGPRRSIHRIARSGAPVRARRVPTPARVLQPLAGDPQHRPRPLRSGRVGARRPPHRGDRQPRLRPPSAGDPRS